MGSTGLRSRTCLNSFANFFTAVHSRLKAFLTPAAMASKAYSWALVLREALGEKIVNYNGEYMTEPRMKVLKFIESKIQIMQLQPEIREIILDHLCEETTIAVFLRGNGYSPATGIKLPVTARAGDRLLRQETIRTALEKTTFRIDSFPGNQSFQDWLERVDLREVSKNYVNGFDAVKHLLFPYFSRFPHYNYPADHPNSDIELMLKCRNLETVNIQWASDVLYQSDGRVKTVDQLRKEFRLDRMLGLANLKQLTVTGRLTWEGEKLLHDLAGWFWDNLVGKGGSKVEVLDCWDLRRGR
ncbi:hypothetical protein D0869_10251 [Hortaea werneckii]|uniref:Uncharacterized protein n=1 Tax=Hortaea werneckii TaxID=91943 RepID=A0A3M7AF03_HORWE|nr:hypothetical protein D0869_10251 [Hortaea werneckii]RMY26013.1 hypothetical protein D0867_00324 [Hortaea werneckii]